MVAMEQHPTIQDLIQRRLDETGWSIRAFAKATGGTVSHQTVSKLASGAAREWPKNAETILGLASALNVPEDTVVLGFASSIGIPVRRQPSMLALQIPRSADLLTTAERTHIVGLVHALVAGRVAEGEASDGGRTGVATAEESETAALEREVNDAARGLADRIGEHLGDGGTRGERESG